jgi:hypothetical protein
MSIGFRIESRIAATAVRVRLMFALCVKGIGVPVMRDHAGTGFGMGDAFRVVLGKNDRPR